MKTTVLGKMILCRIEKYDAYFDSLQAIGDVKLFKCYNSLNDIVHPNINENYHHFLAEPVESGSIIDWHAAISSETPQLFSELNDEDLKTYNKIKSETLKHYYNAISKLDQKNYSVDAEFLEKAIKYIDDRFIYCYDGKIVLCGWGMKLKANVKEDFGVIVKTMYKKDEPIKTDVVKETPPVNNKEENENPRILHDTKTKFDIRKWLNIFILIFVLLLLLFLLSQLFKTCNFGENADNNVQAITDGRGNGRYGGGDEGKMVSDEGGGFGCSSSHDRAKTPVLVLPFDTTPTPRKYDRILPPFQGVLPPTDTTQLVRNPGYPVIIGNRLNILMENDDKTIMDFAEDFKKTYPEDKYQIVYYDNLTRRLQIEIPSEEREKLALEIPEKFAPEYVLFVFDESLFEINYMPNDPIFKNRDMSWYFYAVKAPQAWDITLGSDAIIIAVIDNGFNLNHPELRSKVVMPYNVWRRTVEVYPQEMDHGTIVAGVALAQGDNNKGTAGIAPSALLMPVQVADEWDKMTLSSVIDGILYAIYRGVHVVNCSLSADFTNLGAFPEDFQKQLINNRFKAEERLWNEIASIADRYHTTLVVSAGNENILANVDPMHRSRLIVTVSAVSNENVPYEKAKFSNYGPYSTISAPGVNIYSSTGKNKYATLSGTSLSAPIVSGGIALMKSINNQLTNEQIIDILQSSGSPVCGQIGRLIQLNKAIEATIADKVSKCLACEEK